MGETVATTDDEPYRLTAQQMLAEELAHVRGIGRPAPATAHVTALNLQLSALCLSGGGIRSAAFCLGVLQALARKGLLHRFDYLSTVSGGGFIGGWLQQLIQEQHAALPSEAQAACGAEARVALAEAVLKRHEPPALDRLRDNTNYLTPRAGPASADTWSGAALYIRNLTLNWMVFAPLFLLAALLPIFHRTSIWWLGSIVTPSWTWSLGALVVFMLPLGYGIFLTCRWLPSHRSQRQRLDRSAYMRAIRWIVGVIAAWAFLLPISLQSFFEGNARLDAPWYHAPYVAPLLYLATLVVAYEVAAQRTQAEDIGKGLFSVNRLSWLFAAIGSAAVLAILLQLLVVFRDDVALQFSVADMLALVAPLLLLVVLLAQTTFYLGLRRDAVFDTLDREWLARLNGIILAIGVGWTLFAASCLISSLFTLPHGQSNETGISFAAVITMASGFASSWLGKQVISRAQALAKDSSKQELLIALLQSVLPIVFVVALFALLGALLQLSLGKLGCLFLPCQLRPPPPPSTFVRLVPVALQFSLGVLLCLLIYGLGRIINVNRFSMHAVYRNRLTRAFLGTPRDHRNEDPFTGFDDRDDPRLASFGVSAQGGQRLFPIVNMTLNVTAGGRDAWAERKGSSFTATPLHCGSPDLKLAADALAAAGVYIRTKHFAGMGTKQDRRGKDKGTHFGSMLTISGAAASPNWGYHSSPQIAFLMTLFNVRLGAWYPNPARARRDELQLSKPRNSLRSLLNELLGRTKNDDQAVYLSDGGHFENLGVYEMLRRRCTRVLVVDAAQDGDCKLHDLGMMIRKAEIDLPVKIAITTPWIAARRTIESGKAAVACGFACGTIAYLDSAGSEIGKGEIIYIKPCLLADAPAAVRAFAADSETFPHESTADQWFSESQFESYRSLGEYQGTRLTGLVTEPAAGEPAGDRLQVLFDAARKFRPA